MPLQFLDAHLEVLLHEVGTLVLIVVQHHALQQLLGEGQIAHLLLAVGTHILNETEVAIGHELSLQCLGNLLTESLLVLHATFGEHLIEQFLVHFSLHVARDLGDLEAEISSDILGLLSADLQQ